jgi:hypothetical protein
LGAFGHPSKIPAQKIKIASVVFVKSPSWAEKTGKTSGGAKSRVLGLERKKKPSAFSSPDFVGGSGQVKHCN